MYRGKMKLWQKYLVSLLLLCALVATCYMSYLCYA
jgi:hypothetical protein